MFIEIQPKRGGTYSEDILIVKEYKGNRAGMRIRLNRNITKELRWDVGDRVKVAICNESHKIKIWRVTEQGIKLSGAKFDREINGSPMLVCVIPISQEIEEEIFPEGKTHIAINQYTQAHGILLANYRRSSND